MTWSENNQSFFEGGSECYAITWPKFDWVTISLAEDQTEGKMPKKKQDLKTSAVEAWQSITMDETQRLLIFLYSWLLFCKIRIKAESLQIKQILFLFKFYNTMKNINININI